nr:peptidylprolyl isomerase [Pseudofrankia asymbiotica]
MSGERPRRRELAPEVKVAAFGILAALLLTVGAIALSKSLGGSSSSDDTASVDAQPTASVKPPATSKVGDCVYTEDGNAPARDVTLPPAGPSVDTNPAKMVITTNLGTMTATLDAVKAPCTVHALSYLAEKKYFDGTTCHRETSGPDAGIFVLQCGDPTGTGGGSPGFQYKNENTTGVNYNRGVLAMANAGPDTNGSQFFINYADPSGDGAQALAGSYTVVGQITEGLDILDKITGPGAEGETGDGAPVTKPQILSLTVTQ